MATRLRSCVLLAGGALGLHQLRYALAYGPHAARALREQGHAYLGPVTGAVVAALIFVLALALHRLASGAEEGRGSGRLVHVWLGATVALLVVFSAQESVEGLLSDGHPGGAAALVGGGGWLAVPLAILIGLAIAGALSGLRSAAAATLAVARRLGRTLRPRAAIAFVVPAPPARRRVPVLAAAAAGRAPPLASRAK